MKRPALFLLISFALIQCDTNEDLTSNESCSTPATVRDITGLDACHGFVFELEDGSSLRPIMTFWCGTPPIPESQLNDPLYNFEFVDGKKILIDYELVETDLADACMAGRPARITCLKEIGTIPDETR